MYLSPFHSYPNRSSGSNLEEGHSRDRRKSTQSFLPVVFCIEQRVRLPLKGRPHCLYFRCHLIVRLFVRCIVFRSRNEDARSGSLCQAGSSQIVLAWNVDVSNVLVFTQYGEMCDDIDRADITSNETDSTQFARHQPESDGRRQ